MLGKLVDHDGLLKLRWNTRCGGYPCVCFSYYESTPAYITMMTDMLTDIVCRWLPRFRTFVNALSPFQLRKEWGYKYWVTSDAGAVDLLKTLHGTCETRECAAKIALENGLSGEMGGG